MAGKVYKLYGIDGTKQEITDEIFMANSLRRLSRIVSEDESGQYLDMILSLLHYYASLFPYDQSPAINKFEEKIKEAQFWLDEHFNPSEE